MRVLLTGATGQLGSWIVRAWRDRDGELIGWSAAGGRVDGLDCPAVDLGGGEGVRRALDEVNPDVILHAAAVSKPDAARRDPARAWQVNVRGTERLCAWCRARGRRLVLTSTDMVFDGSRGLYAEDDAPSPVVEYGRTKTAAETLARELPRGLVARVCLLYGPSLNGRPTFFHDAVRALRRGERRAFFADEYRTPLDLGTAARALIALAQSDAVGVVHLGGVERLSRVELFRRLAPVLRLDPSLIDENRLADVPSPEPRPADVSLRSERLTEILPGLRRPTVEEAAAEWR
jgi:dTDP-4-dehydrorhamnose reductase